MSIWVRRSCPRHGTLRRSSPQCSQNVTSATSNGLDGAGVGQSAPARCVLPLPWAPGRLSAVSSFGVCEDGTARVGAVLGGVLLHEHRHQQLEQHQHGLEQRAAFPGHLPVGAQLLEARLKRVELLPQRLLVDAGHEASVTRYSLLCGLDRHHRRQHGQPLRPAATLGSACPSSRPCA